MMILSIAHSITSYNHPLKDTRSTHPLDTPSQHILSTHPLNTSSSNRGLYSAVYGPRHAETLGVLLPYANLLYQLQKNNLTGKGSEGWVAINEIYQNALSIQIEHNYGGYIYCHIISI